MKTILIKITSYTMFWNILNWFIALVTTEISWISNWYAPLILALLSFLTKYLNKTYNPYYKYDTK